MEIVSKYIDKNFTHGRNGNIITGIVMHTYGGKGGSLYNWFNNRNAKVSAHYAVLKDGTIEKYVRDVDTAWHAGTANDNVQTIGIEHQDDGDYFNSETYTARQIEASSQLVAELCRKYKIPCRNAVHGIRKHNEIVKNRACPGALPFDKIINNAAHILSLETDNLYKVFELNKQLAAFKIKANAFSYWYKDNDKRTVLFNKENITSEFRKKMNTLENKIQSLEKENKDLSDMTERYRAEVHSLKDKVENLEYKNSLIQKELDILNERIISNLSIRQLWALLVSKILKKFKK